jgi:ribose transport system permease protein
LEDTLSISNESNEAKAVNFRRYFREHFETITIYLVLLAVAFIGALLSPDFIKSRNLLNVLLQAVALGLVSIGQTVVILSGGLDLSVGATISMVAVYSSGLMGGHPGFGVIIPVILLTTCMALAVGLLNSQLVSRFRITPFIATLASGSMIQGVVLMYTKRPKGLVSPEWKYFAEGTVGPIPVAVIFFIIVVGITFFILSKTVLGRYIYATGGNENASRLSGIRIDRVLIFVYVFSSFTAALSALFLISRMGIGDPQVGGLTYQRYDLESIAAVLVGGTVLGGGSGGVIGTVAGVLILTLLNNIFNLVGVSTFYQWCIKGAIIIGAVAIYRVQQKTRTS